MRAIDLAVAQSDEYGQRHRLEHVKLTVPDTEAVDSARAEAANAEFASSDPSALAYIGPYTSAGAAISLPITNRAGLLQIGVSQTWPGLTQPSWDSGEPERYYPTGLRTYVRLSSPDSAQAEAASKWAFDVGVHKVVLVSDGSSYSNGMRDYFRRALQAEGLSVVGLQQFSDSTFSPTPEEIKSLAADAVFYAPSTTRQAVAFAKVMESVNLSSGIFSTDTALDDQFAGNVPGLGGTWHIVFNGPGSLPSSRESSDFRRAFAAAYGREPEIFGAYAYDATKLIIKAVDSSSRVDRATVLRDMLSTKQYLGASGNVAFDDNGDATGWTMLGYRLKNGLFVLERTLTSEP